MIIASLEHYLVTVNQIHNKMNVKELKNELRLTADGDNWGNAMLTWFECAGQMNKRRLAVPVDWQYRPGMGLDGTDEENYFCSLFRSSHDEDLVQIGEFLCRYCRLLEYKGESY